MQNQVTMQTKLDPYNDTVAVELLQELVSIPSLSTHEEAATTWLVDQMDRLGFDQAFRDAAGNAVGIRTAQINSKQETETVVLLGHIDTVPGEIPVRIEDGCLHGRGSVDAKGSLATFTVAAARAALPDHRNLIVIGAVEEEATSSKGARFAATQYQPDWCVIGEPSGADAVTLGYKGRLQVDCRLRQSAAHSAGPQIAVAEKLIEWWHKLSEWVENFNSDKRGIFDQLQISLAKINTRSDGMYDEVIANIGLRLPVDFPIEKFQTHAETCHSFDDGVVRCDSDFTFYGQEVAHKEPRTSKLVNRFNQVFRQADLKPKHKLKTGTSDMNVVVPVWQCPIVAYGPGDSSLDHTPNEHLSVDEYLVAITRLQTVLETP